ncbi:hypothetical protein HELRODRAFT_83677 [Helobdella robusta]|uniref:Sodium-coupled monocarboxylate transporter 1 n=1 Tax=Helobdella robusta TaxID=6412 RepID=T1G590_HELRO|nr:hypothetical protein HELRODRAFT_83677 [Helobdella robusta]ESO00064.1 hypothetical protein HELRODRAFT_83677 [Helobdella robusta]
MPATKTSTLAATTSTITATTSTLAATTSTIVATTSTIATTASTIATSATTAHFHWLDHTIFIAFLAFSTLVGVFFGWRSRRSTSSEKFLTGGGEIHWIFISFSMQASFFSAIFLLSTPGEVYAYGTCYSYLGLSYFIGKPLVVHFYIPVLYKMKILTVYEYLERRFNKFIRVCGSVIFLLETLLYIPLVLYTPALALAQVTGISILWSIIFCGLVCTLYTCLGGMKATAFNDTVQMMIIFFGLITVIGVGIARVGGFGEFLKRNLDGGRFIFNDFRIDPTLRTTFWTQVLGGTLFTAYTMSANQVLVQKFLSSKNLKSAYKSLYLSIICCFTILVLVIAMGLLSYAFYYRCDPLSSARVRKLDQVVPLMMVEILEGYPGLSGLFMTVAFSAALRLKRFF